MLFSGAWNASFLGDWNVHLEITLLEFLKTISKAIIITIIILLTLLKYDPLFSFFLFFSVRATTLNFFEFCFYDLKRFLANFQGYIASSGQKLFQSVWKQVPKKDQEKPTFVKKWARQKRAYQYANLFVLKSFILSWSKSLKGFKLIAFMVLDRFLGDHIWSSPLSCLFLPYTVYTQRPYGIRLNYFFILFRISKYC